MQMQQTKESHYCAAVVRDRSLELAAAMMDLGDIATRDNIKAELGWSDGEIDYHMAEARRIASRKSTRRVA